MRMRKDSDESLIYWTNYRVVGAVQQKERQFKGDIRETQLAGNIVVCRREQSRRLLFSR
jgi:hypothetical protein